MEMPNIPSSGGNKEERSPLYFRNLMQRELAKRNCVDCENNALIDWIIKELSPKFKTVLEQNPKILELFKEDPENALAQAESLMHLEHLKETKHA